MPDIAMCQDNLPDINWRPTAELPQRFREPQDVLFGKWNGKVFEEIGWLTVGNKDLHREVESAEWTHFCPINPPAADQDNPPESGGEFTD